MKSFPAFPKTFSSAVRAAARQSAVQVSTPSSRGSGFFGRAGLVFTCAHVVGSHDIVTVTWDDLDYAGTVLQRFPDEAESDDPDLWPFPDVAIIRLKSPPAHPVPYLSDSTPAEGDQLVAYGFADSVLQPGPQRDGVTLTIADTSGDYLRVTNDQIVSGMSGSLVLSTDTGLIVGMIKASRNTQDALGGWICPSTIFTRLLDSTVGTTERVDSALHDDIWTDALLTPVRALLKAQVEMSAALPYRLMDPPVPQLGEVYVRQQTEGERGPTDIGKMLADHRHALVIGQPGSGKSALLRHICYTAALWWLKREGAPPFGNVIPVRVTAASFSQPRAFFESLAAAVRRDLGPLLDTAITPELFARPPLPGVSWLIMIDGIDEIIDSDQRIAVIRAIEQRIQDLDRPHRILVTTRPLLVSELKIASSVPRFDLMMFDAEQVDDFAKNWFTTRKKSIKANTVEEAQSVAKRFVKEVRKADLESLAKVPLLLTIAAIVFEQDPSHELPPTITILYERFVDFLFSRFETPPTGTEAVPADIVQLRGRQVALIESTAYRWFFDSNQPIFEVALELVTTSSTHPVRDTAQLREYLRALLSYSGVIVVGAPDLDWIHLSIAEYLASRVLARKSSPEHWLWLADRPGTANIARLALIQYARKHPLNRGLIEQLSAQQSALLSLRELLGTPGLLPDESVVQLTRAAESRGELEAAPFAAHRAAAAVLRASLTSRRFKQKLAAAKALIRDGAPSDVRAGITAVTAVAAGFRPRRRQLTAISQLIVVVRVRQDAVSFEHDIDRLQSRGQRIILRWWRPLRSQTKQVVKWPHALPGAARRRILSKSCTSRWVNNKAKVGAAYALARDFDDPQGVDTLNDLQRELSRFRRPGKATSWRGDPALFGLITAIATMSVSISVIFISNNSTNDLYNLRYTITAGIALIIGLGVPAYFRPWWERRTKPAVKATEYLRNLSNNGCQAIRQRSKEAARESGPYVAHQELVTLREWLRRKPVRTRAHSFAVASISQGGSDQEKAIIDLRQILTSSNPIDQRAISNELYDTAYKNPRSARTLLHLLRADGSLGKRKRGQVESLLSVLDDNDGF